MKKFKKENAITLVSLVITIIILLVLATITIQSLTNVGLFKNASKAELETIRSQIAEWLCLKVMEAQAYYYDKNSEEIINKVRQDIEKNKTEIKNIVKTIDIDGEVSTEEDGMKVSPYFYIIADNDVYRVSMEEQIFIGEADKIVPEIDFECTATTNSISAKVTTKRNKGGKLEYYIKDEGETDYREPVTTTEKEYTFRNLIHNKTYYIKIIAVSENGQTASKEQQVTVGSIKELTQNDIKLTYSINENITNKEKWTNQDVTVSVNLKEKVETQAELIAEGTKRDIILVTKKNDEKWEKVNFQTFSENGIFYTALSDGVNYGVATSVEITNIDKAEPVINLVESTKNSININATDSESGIIGYAVTTTNTQPSDTEYKIIENTKTLTTTVLGLTQATKYYVWVKDEAGNTSESYEVTTKVQLVTELQLSSSSITLIEGGTATIIARILPSDAYNKNVTFTSSNTGVAIVSSITSNSDGSVTAIIKAIAQGTTTIIAKTQDDDNINSSCSIIVKSKEMYLYNQGDQCTSITGGWNYFCRYSVAGAAFRKSR